jgi:Fur family transcriptional regulator, ferric uptake regulator
MTNDKNRNKKISDILEKNGLKKTTQRSMVYDMLMSSAKPLTAEDIYLELRQKDALISVSTVYRILGIFVSKGIVARSGFMRDNKSMYQLGCVDNRHRLICLGCKKILPFERCLLEECKESLEKQTDFKISEHRLEVFGYCRECSREYSD